MLMSEMKRLTWNQIKGKYPEQWVRLEDVEWLPGNDATVNAAVVAKAGDVTTKDRVDAMHGKCFVMYVEAEPYFHTGVVTA